VPENTFCSRMFVAHANTLNPVNWQKKFFAALHTFFRFDALPLGLVDFLRISCTNGFYLFIYL